MSIESVTGTESVSSHYATGVHTHHHCTGNCPRVDILVVCWLFGLIILGPGREMTRSIYIAAIDSPVWVFVPGL